MTAAVAKVAVNAEEHVTFLRMWCPGCDENHAIVVDRHGAPGISWQWDGNLEAPTVSPSIKVTGTQWNRGDGFYKPTHQVEPGGQIVCHSFVRDGQWQFLGDCTHHLAGRTVAMVPIPTDS